MKFCPTCGNQLNDDAGFCPNCGTKMGESQAPEVNQQSDSGTYSPQQTGGGYYQTDNSQSSSTQGGYTQPGSTQGGYTQPDSTQGGYTQPGSAQGGYTQPGSAQGGYTQPGPQNYQSGPQNYQAPQSYPGGPPPSGGSGNNKLLIIIIAVIVGLGLIGGGIFAYSKLSPKNNTTISSNDFDDDDDADVDADELDDADDADDDDDTNDADAEETGFDFDADDELDDDYDIEDDYEFGDNADNGDDADDGYTDNYDDGDDYDNGGEYVYADINDFLATFDTAAADDILYALEDTGMNTAYASDFYYYGEWFNGWVYSFTYENSVIDLLMNYDDTVFSVETMGAQIYLAGYGSYWLDDYLGSTTHYDENWPEDGYMFYLDDPYTTSYGWINMTTGYEYDYVVTLTDAYTENLVIAFYIYGGHQDDWYWDVPPGDYIIEYAAGTTWYNIDEMFGPDTMYFRVNDIYSFYDGEDVYITLDVGGGGGTPSTDVTSEYAY